MNDRSPEPDPTRNVGDLASDAYRELGPAIQKWLNKYTPKPEAHELTKETARDLARRVAVAPRRSDDKS